MGGVVDGGGVRVGARGDGRSCLEHPLVWKALQSVVLIIETVSAPLETLFMPVAT
jgi:hypothetical protein